MTSKRRPLTVAEKKNELRRLNGIKIARGNWTTGTIPMDIELDTGLGWLCIGCHAAAGKAAVLGSRSFLALCDECLDDMPVFGKQGRAGYGD